MVHARHIVLIAGLLAFSGSAAPAQQLAQGEGDPFPELEALRPNIEFWTLVFGKWSLGQVAVHDQRYPALVYQVVDLPGGAEQSYTTAQKQHAGALREYWQDYLLRLERKVEDGAPLDDIDKQWVLHFATVVGADKLAGAHERVRTQRGMRERFREGLGQSFRFDRAIREILREHGLPEELAYLPHVESSFQYQALSSAGAAGIWQFTRGTGKRFMRVTTAIDERLDPLTATRAAAQYLKEAYARLGTWPLAVTSYNHGVQGMARARERFGTDFERIYREYDGPSFGFASRNFYAEFLAARRVARDPDRYFPEGFTPERELDHESVLLESRASPQWIAGHYGVPLDDLVSINLAWSNRAVANGLKLPAGITVHLPAGTLGRLQGPRASAGRTAEPTVEAGAGAVHVVRAGDTLSAIASKYGVQLEQLRAMNGIAGQSSLIREGQRLRLPAAGTEPPREHVVRHGETLSQIASRYRIALLDLLTQNTLASHSTIHPGQVLLIPH